MNIWLVSPAWSRFTVTRLALAERRWLCDELASRGHQANSVIVADDDNLDIAAEYGFHTVELDNTDLGAKFNAGYRYAARQDADLFVHVGSDDWIHPDTFGVIDKMDLEFADDMEPDDGGTIVWTPGPILIAQRRLLIVDLNRQAARRCQVKNRWGCIPWLIPRAALQPRGFAPIPKGLKRGIDGALAHGLGHKLNWVWQDAQHAWCVDWKTEMNLTPYIGLSHSLGDGDEQEAWPILSEFYPDALVEAAKQTAAAHA